MSESSTEPGQRRRTHNAGNSDGSVGNNYAERNLLAAAARHLDSGHNGGTAQAQFVPFLPFTGALKPVDIADHPLLMRSNTGNRRRISRFRSSCMSFKPSRTSRKHSQESPSFLWIDSWSTRVTNANRALLSVPQVSTGIAGDLWVDGTTRHTAGNKVTAGYTHLSLMKSSIFLKIDLFLQLYNIIVYFRCSFSS
ncbi:hypothetical protein ElyMa_002502000 [Elysia marginata]|uniref:Uncharacterized protein n=1 Tax=Elysia marginata TaxID=1093978 RepID=A0AAV4GSB1_9GAST|nr:hypothetical protein ElyMa_002502000 [Elysia marginata]